MEGMQHVVKSLFTQIAISLCVNDQLAVESIKVIILAYTNRGDRYESIQL